MLSTRSGQPRGVAVRGSARRRLATLWTWIVQYRRALGLVFMAVMTFASGSATNFDLAFRLGYVLIIMLVIAYAWSRIGFARMDAVVRRPTRPLRVGEQLSEMVQVTNHGGLPNPWIEIEELSDIPGLHAGRVVDMPGMIVTRRFEVTAGMTMRGEFRLGPLIVRSADPFGLFPNSREYQGSDSLLVYPRVVSIPDFAMAHLNLSGDAGDRRRTHLVSPHVSSVRDYVAGDSISRIHWPSTARQGKLMVKLFDQGEAGEVWIVFDQRADTVAGDGPESADEYGATIAASAVEKYQAMQLPVGFVTYGSRPMSYPAVRGAGQTESIARTIAVSKPTGDTELVDIFGELDPMIGANTALIVITASRDSTWVPALEGLQRRGVNVSVALMDRASFLTVGQRGGEPADASNRAVLEALVMSGVRVYSVRCGVPLPSSLAGPVTEAHLAALTELGPEAAGSVAAGGGD